MSRRSRSNPPLDLIPIMGLMSLLIPLLLLGNGVAFGVIDATAPAMCACHGGEGEPSLVPSIAIHEDGIALFLDAPEPEEFARSDLDGLTERLVAVANAHQTTGNVVLMPDPDVAYEGLIAVMDASRPAFPHVTVAGGVP